MIIAKLCLRFLQNIVVDVCVVFKNIAVNNKDTY